MELELFLASIRKSMMEIHRDIESLLANNSKNEHQVLEHLNREVMILDGKLKKLDQTNKLRVEEIPVFHPKDNTQNISEVNTTRSITRQELAVSNGKNGNPAYVAIDGFVYDVTNNPAWGAGTHFGLGAGRDLTNEFASCHEGENILKKLPVVGFLS
ncbi:cytochrome b5 domain-containing protein [Anaerotignum sp.]|uniref:cytochrome b5 domain-containing protein n=1 Tax=Anaerotignum sp. TaxID=2039241 RepID=UPI00331A7352